MKACILTIGNEILKGKTVNTNAAEIGRMLYFSGYEIFRGLTVPDIDEEIGEAFRSLVGVCNVIVSSGGLGPTFDDITIPSFAKAFGIRLVLDEETYEEIRRKTEAREMKMTKEREKMAMVPEGSKIIKNDVGSAPGIEYQIGQTRIFILPGVPAEMRSMLDRIRNEIALKDSFYYEDSVAIRGVYEASLAPYVNDLMLKYNGTVYIKSHPAIVPETRESELEVEVSARSERLDASRTLVTEVLKEIVNIAAELKGNRGNRKVDQK
jgi:molybdenum cofactor synthesis domain-containing protein